jgi:hypothetical protein
MPDLSKFTVELLVLAALVAATLGLALYRIFQERNNDFHIHTTANEAMSVGKQDAIAHKIDWVDRWGKGLTIVTVAYFMVVLGLVLYNEWLRSASTIQVN